MLHPPSRHPTNPALGHPGRVPFLLAAAMALAITVATTVANADGAEGPDAEAIHQIKHVVIIMQKNRSFDHYFGTYPGASGIPMRVRKPAVCVPDPKSRRCVRPFHDVYDLNLGGPHSAGAEIADVHRGRLDGFIRQERIYLRQCKTGPVKACRYADEPPRPSTGRQRGCSGSG